MRFQANIDFNYLGVISSIPNRVFYAYNKLHSVNHRSIGYMSSEVLDPDVLGELLFIRNQNLKQGMFCLFKANNNDTIISSFFEKDDGHPKKKLVLKNDHADSKADCMLIFSHDVSSLDDLRVGALTLEEGS